MNKAGNVRTYSVRKRVGLSPDTFLIIEPLIFSPSRSEEVERGEEEEEGEKKVLGWGCRLTD